MTYSRVFILSAPIILSNFAQPLLGAVDIAVIGHTETAIAIGAVAVGAILIGFLFWLFGFLKMVTTGLTAQAFGAYALSDRTDNQQTSTDLTDILARALLIATAISFGLVLFQYPLAQLSLWFFDLEPEARHLAETYFSIRIWAAPAALGLYCFIGWFVGLQKTSFVLWLMLFANFVNIGLDLVFVSLFHWGVVGVAWASLIAEYATFVLGAWFAWKSFPHRFEGLIARLKSASYRNLLTANLNIMVRTLCLQLSFLAITRFSAKLGVTALAANTILLHFFYLVAHAMDGFTHAAESLTGKALGQQNLVSYRRAFKLTLHWTLLAGFVCAVFIAIFGSALLPLFTNLEEVQAYAAQFIWWPALVALVSPFTFHLDGIFIGATRTREMRDAMLVSTGLYFALLLGFFHLFENHGIWAALVVFMIIRALSLAYFLPRLFASVQPDHA